jgi:hypothetical protein
MAAVEFHQNFMGAYPLSTYSSFRPFNSSFAVLRRHTNIIVLPSCNFQHKKLVPVELHPLRGKFSIEDVFQKRRKNTKMSRLCDSRPSSRKRHALSEVHEFKN